MHYKRNKRRVLALFVLVAAVMVSVSILTPSDEKKSDTPKDITARTNSNLQFKSSGSNLLGSIAEDPTPRTKTQRETDNLTDILIRSYSLKVFDDSNALPPEEEVAEYLRDQLTEGSLNIKSFTLSSVIVSPDNSEVNQIKYLETLDLLFRKHFGEFENKYKKREILISALERFYENNDPVFFSDFAKNIPFFIDDALTLEVPELWKELHVEMLNLFQEQLVTYRALADFQTDPLKAYIASQKMPDIAGKYESIQTLFLKHYQELTSNS